MAAAQSMCARIGMVTGEGLAGALRKKFPRPLIRMASFALLIANTINIGADLSGMADAGAMMTGVDSRILVVVQARPRCRRRDGSDHVCRAHRPFCGLENRHADRTHART